jgi:ElaB/YqjD/DUF883 family membrane-anchored ribosome-binding protein
MVAELKEVLQKLGQLDSDEQKSIAKMINDELEWENTLKNTQDKLATLAKEAIEEYQSGKTKKEDW